MKRGVKAGLPTASGAPERAPIKCSAIRSWWRTLKQLYYGVELLPVAQFASEPRLQRMGPYHWGYNPMAMFALYPARPVRPRRRWTSFVMRKRQHRAGIEVILGQY